jgi:hypothetical protein
MERHESRKDVGYTEMTETIVMPALEKAGFFIWEKRE